MEGGTRFNFGHELECDYCGEPFSIDQYTIELPNGESVGTFCTKECRRGYNRWVLGPPGTDRWRQREQQFNDGRRVNYPPPPTVVKDRRKTCRNQWLPQCWVGLNYQEMSVVKAEIEFCNKRKK